MDAEGRSARGLSATETAKSMTATVLMLCADPPNVRSGGGIRTYHCAKALSERVGVHLAVLLPGDKANIPKDLTKQCVSVFQTEKHYQSKAGSDRNNYAATILRAFPWLKGQNELIMQVRRYCANRPERSEKAGLVKRTALFIYRSLLELQDVTAARLFKLPPSRTAERLREFNELLPRLKDEYVSNSFDLIWIEHSFLLPFLPELLAYFGSIPVVCNSHNVEYSYHERMAELVCTPSARRWWRRQARLMKKAEASGIQAASLTFCCSREDQQLFQGLVPAARVEVLPNGVDTTFFENQFAETEEPSLVFTGGMSYAPNQDAVEYFVDDVLPLIREEIPDCRFILAGSSAAGRFPQIELNDPLTEIASDVADIRPYTGKAWVYVVPLRVGSGTRLKILEAMSMGKAIVSSPIGAEGIDTEAGDNLILAKGADSFAEAVVTLVRNRERARNMGESARRLVCENYDWKLLTSRAIEACKRHGLLS